MVFIKTGGVLAGSAGYFFKFAGYWRGISIVGDLTCQYMLFGQSACMFHISYGLQWRQSLRYIAVALPVAETCNSAPGVGLDDITSFFGPSFLPISWRKHRF